MEEEVAAPATVRAVGGGDGYTGASPLSADLEIAIAAKHPVSQALGRFVRRNDGEESIFGVATVGSFFLRLFQLDDGVMALHVLTVTLSVAALSRAAAEVAAAVSAGAGINYDLEFGEVVRAVAERTSRVPFMFSASDFMPVEPFPAGTATGIVKTWTQVGLTTVNHLVRCRGGPSSAPTDNRVLADAWAGFGARGRAADRMPEAIAGVVLMELLSVFPASFMAVASNLGNQIKQQCEFTVGPACVDEIAGDPETFLSNIAFGREISRGAVDAVATRLSLAVSQLPNLAIALEGAEDQMGSVRRLIAATGAATTVTADALVSLDVELGGIFNEALTNPTGGLTRVAYAINTISKHAQALKAHVKQNSNAADPLASTRDAAEARELFQSGAWKQMQADLREEADAAKRLQIVLSSGNHLLLSACAIGS